MKSASIPILVGSIFLLILAIALYILHNILMISYIKKRAPEFANDEMWEFTAGMGVVPKWVSYIGLLAISALIAAVLPWIWMLFK